MSLLLALGGSDATAPGASLGYALSLLPGAASGGSAIDATANGATVSYAESLTPGAVTASSQASGATVGIGYSIIAGAAQAASQAQGQALPLAYSLLPGSASGAASATASGATVSYAYALLAGIASGSGVATGGRGDDAFRSAGATRKFWAEKADEWLEKSLSRVKAAAEKPVAARETVADDILSEASDRLIDWPAFAPQIDAVQRIAQRLAVPAVDYSEIARYIADQMQAVEAARRAMRRKRDLEAILMLVD